MLARGLLCQCANTIKIQLDLEQTRHQYHPIECNLLSPWNRWHIAHFGVKQQSLTHSIEAEQLIRCPNEKGQKDNNSPQNTIVKTSDLATWNANKMLGWNQVLPKGKMFLLRCVNHVRNSVIGDAGRNRECIVTTTTYPWASVTQIFCNI
jgi:hypothetical protein